MGEVSGKSKEKFKYPEDSFLVVKKVSLPNYLHNHFRCFWFKFLAL